MAFNIPRSKPLLFSGEQIPEEVGDLAEDILKPGDDFVPEAHLCRIGGCRFLFYGAVERLDLALFHDVENKIDFFIAFIISDKA